MENELLEHVANAKQASDIVNDAAYNELYYNSIVESPDGVLTKQAAAGDLYLKREIRERAVVRRVMDFETAPELVRVPGEEAPILWGEWQNTSRGAVSLTFKDTADSESFWRDTFTLRFFVISTPEYYKDTFELKGHVQDSIKHLHEDMLLDIEEEEDRRWFTAMDDIVGALDGLSDVGLPQHHYYGEFSHARFVDTKYLFTDRKLPRGIFVVNERFFSNFEKLPADQIGNDIAQKMFLEGSSALKEGTVGGVTHLFTSKNHYVPDQTVYQFTAADYLGFCREHQPPTMYMEKKKRMIYCQLEEIIAMSVPNIAGVNKGVYANKPEAS
jgi:hypothetical protein